VAVYTEAQRRSLFGQFLRAYRRTGNFRASAHLVGVDERTLRDWCDGDLQFRRRRDRARSDLVHRLADAQVTSAIVPDEHGRRDTRAGQWLLERLDPETYPSEPAERSPMDGSLFQQLREVAGDLTDEERDKLREMAKKRILGEQPGA
jgi:hypothetical protein